MRTTTLAALILLSCGGTGSTGVSTCVPGASAACTCSNGKTGAQVCNGAGTFDACDCSGGSGGGAGGGAGGGSGGGAGGGGGSGGGSAGPKKRIFLTAASYMGNLGGLAGADAKCTTAAQAANLTGTFKAWLSDDTTNAIDRITGNGPWYLVTGTSPVFNNKANLGTIPLSGINVTEQGNAIFNQLVWTGTGTGGMKAATTCTGWTKSAPSPEVGFQGQNNTASWTQYGAAECDGLAHLYCLEQ